MGGIFINYRKGAGRERLVQALCEELAGYFGDGQVFLDRRSIDLGDDYRSTLTDRLLDAEVVIAVIHREWADELRQRQDGKDWVRRELELALQQPGAGKQGKKIIPLLLHGNRVPPAETLPSSVHEIAYQQGHRLRSASWADDVRALIRKLELHVAPSWQRSDPGTVAPTPARRWPRYSVAAIALGALVTAMLALPQNRAAREVAVTAAVSSLPFMLAPLIALLGVFLLKRRINTFENSVHDMPIKAYYARVALPLGALLLLFSGSSMLSAPPPAELVPFLLFIVSVTTAYLIFKYRQQHKDEKLRTDAWPQRMPEPVRPAAARQELARLQNRIDVWPEYRATRELCDRADWHLRHLRSASEALSTDARRGRWRWLIADHPFVLNGYAAWLAGSIGIIIAAALAQQALWLPLAVVSLFVGVAVATAEVAYRHQLWRRTTVVDEIDRHASTIEQRLTTLRERRA
jgi:TIR domain